MEFVCSAPTSMSHETFTPALRHCLRAGRHALAAGAGLALENAEKEHGPIARLLALLWHERPDARQQAAAALPGGDPITGIPSRYSRFVGLFLRALHRQTEETPVTFAERYACVSATLRDLLRQSLDELRGLLQMHYSFLGNAFYLAVLFTCRDVVEAIGRLRVAQAQSELCQLLSLLAHRHLSRRVNAEDAGILAQSTGRALAALPPDATPDFWHLLACAPGSRRLAATPVLAHLNDARAVPFLLQSLPGQPARLLIPLFACLGRIADARALPALASFARSRDRNLRANATAAMAAIERAQAQHPARELLRPIEAAGPETLLRPTYRNGNIEPPHELLRVAGASAGNAQSHESR